MKTGLVLEGGAMRGMYTAGALDVLLENDINFDGIIGTLVLRFNTNEEMTWCLAQQDRQECRRGSS